MKHIIIWGKLNVNIFRNKVNNQKPEVYSKKSVTE